MSTRAEDRTGIEIVATEINEQRMRSNAQWKPRVQFYSLLALVCLLLAHGAWGVYNMFGNQGGSIERHVGLLLLVFYASTLPALTYFAWRQYQGLAVAQSRVEGQRDSR